ncbi:MAG: matrixin family metalloprotease [Planctomycetes bacterium]|nr:matrixin family metalloprotease [Planctomycetota bacterium]
MRLSRFVRSSTPVLALAVAAALALPRSVRAFTLGGWALGIDQRDVAVFDDFTDPEANDNEAASANFPGYDGAELAIWKATAEWGSELFGDGSGDPTQPLGLGSGDANFDAIFVGNATGPGGAHDNTVSEIAGPGGGLLGITEADAGGWRIRLYSDITWDDDPSGPAPGAVDLQAVITHEYGHVLGLGHSVVSGATMSATASGTSLAARSIEADDKAGVQSIYGVKSASKPHIASVSGSSPLTIQGANFDATSNEIWFTPWPGTSAAPVVVSGVSSSLGGTQLVVAVPIDAGPGNVLVRVAGTSGDKLSNAFPFASPWDVTTYCVAKTNSKGCVPSIAFDGLPSLTVAPGIVRATDVLNQKSGVLFYGTSGALAAPFLGGTLCVKPPIHRTAVANSGGNPPPLDCSGTFTFDLHAYLAAGTDPALVVGAQMWLQFWSRDPGFAPPNNVGLTDALSVFVIP